jgi:hypothetical protein
VSKPIAPQMPFVWPEPRVSSGIGRYETELPFEVAARAALSVFGVVSAIDAQAANWMEGYLADSAATKLRLVVSIHPTCRTSEGRPARPASSDRTPRRSRGFQGISGGDAARPVIQPLVPVRRGRRCSGVSWPNRKHGICASVAFAGEPGVGRDSGDLRSVPQVARLAVATDVACGRGFD